jgi:hypothetical protein
MLTCYLLANSTLINNYGIIYLVNDKNLLVLGSFIQAQNKESVKASIISFLIFKKSKQVITNILNIKQKKNKRTFTLKNIVVIKEFYINIVLKACLQKKGL